MKTLKTKCEPTICVFQGETNDTWGMTEEEYIEFWNRAEDFTLVFECKDGSREIIPMHFIDHHNGCKTLYPEKDFNHNIWSPDCTDTDISKVSPVINFYYRVN